MTRFAPRVRNSRARRSPTSSATVSVDVATAMPTISAAAVSTFRRGVLMNDSLTRRANIGLGMNRLRRTSEVREIDDDFSPFDARFYRDRIGAAFLADRRSVNDRAAVSANEVLALLAITFR